MLFGGWVTRLLEDPRTGITYRLTAAVQAGFNFSLRGVTAWSERGHPEEGYSPRLSPWR